MSVLENFSNWKEFLSDKVDQAKDKGMNNDIISNVAHQVGDYLNNHVDPKNEEQRVLKDLWDVSSEEEQQALANIMVKLVQSNK